MNKKKFLITKREKMTKSMKEMGFFFSFVLFCHFGYVVFLVNFRHFFPDTNLNIRKSILHHEPATNKTTTTTKKTLKKFQFNSNKIVVAVIHGHLNCPFNHVSSSLESCESFFFFDHFKTTKQT